MKNIVCIEVFAWVGLGIVTTTSACAAISGDGPPGYAWSAAGAKALDGSTTSGGGSQAEAGTPAVAGGRGGAGGASGGAGVGSSAASLPRASSGAGGALADGGAEALRSARDGQAESGTIVDAGQTRDSAAAGPVRQDGGATARDASDAAIGSVGGDASARSITGGAGGASGLGGASGASGSGGAGGGNANAGARQSEAGGSRQVQSATGAGGRANNSASTRTATPVMPSIRGTCPRFVAGTSSITVGGLSGILLQTGPQQDGTGSLLFYWHGTGSSASEVNSTIPSSVRQEILDEGGIVVSFQGSLGSGADCSGTFTFSTDDFEVADQIAACAVRDYGIDPRRIYTTGCSAGGLQAGCMGELRSSYIAATAPNSGGLISSLSPQTPNRVPAVMTMHGGLSDMVIVAFSQTSALLDSAMKQAGAFVVNCNHGGGHCMAPSALYSAAWQFMKAHPFGVTPEPYASGLPKSFPSYCEIFE